MTTTITVCNTCRVDRDTPLTPDSSTDGANLAELIRSAAENTALEVREYSCLARCSCGCNLSVQGRGKMTFVLSDVTPSEENASSIVEFAHAHAQTDDGLVTWRERPEYVRKHTVGRIPDLDLSPST